MKTKLLIISLVVLVIVLFLGALPETSNKDEFVEPSSLTTTQDSTYSDSNTLSPSVNNQNGKYVVYQDQDISEIQGKRRVLFFYANWCPTCRPADAEFQRRVSEIPSDVTLIRVNYNDTETSSMEDTLADIYGVSYQHTYVQIDSTGEKVATWNGGAVNELLKNLVP